MSDRRVVWFMVVIALVGTTAAGVSLAPTAALFSDADTFEDNQLGAADDWDRIAIDASVTPKPATVNESATLRATLENVGAGPVVADYEIVVDNEPVDSGIVEFASGESKTVSHKFDISERGDINWQVTANNETEKGTLAVENSAVEVSSVTNETNGGNGTESDDNETDENNITTLDGNSGPESTNSTDESETNDENVTITDNDGESGSENSTDSSQSDQLTDDGNGETESTSDSSDTEEKEAESDT